MLSNGERKFPVFHFAARSCSRRARGAFWHTGGMMFQEPSRDWIGEYAKSHRHPLNRVCHTIGIPLVAGSIPLFAILLFLPDFWPIPVALFVIGWIFQFAGHYAEGKPPEFFHDWRFLFVGLRWWFAKVRGRA